MQETFLDAFRGFANLRDPERAGAWLFTILRRNAAGYRKTGRMETELVHEPSIPGPDNADALVRSIVVERLSELCEEDREILAGKYFLGLSYRELSESLGIREATIMVRCLRAKEKLREALSNSGVGVSAGQKAARGEQNGM